MNVLDVERVPVLLGSEVAALEVEEEVAHHVSELGRVAVAPKNRSDLDGLHSEDGDLLAPDVKWGPYEPAIRRWEAVAGPAPAPLDSGRLSADFVEWMMAFPPGWTDGKRNQRLKALGNAVVWPQAVLALRMLDLSANSRSGGMG